MLPRFLRLNRTQTRVVAKTGQRIHTPLFDLTYSIVPNTTTHWMIVVAKKQVRFAHARNRLKRLMSEALLPLIKHTTKPIQAVIKIKAAPNTSLDQFTTILTDVLRKIET